MSLKHLASFLGAVLFSFVTLGQDFDSLQTQYQSYTTKDSTRVNLLLRLAKAYTTRDIGKQPALLNEAKAISQQIHYALGEAKALSALSKYHVTKGELDQALTQALQARQLYSKLNYDTGFIEVNNVIARVYRTEGLYEKALALHMENLKIGQKGPVNANLAGLFFYVGKTYESMEKNDSALYYYQQAKQVSEKTKFDVGIAISNGAIGHIYNNAENFKAALPYLNYTLEQARRQKHTTNIAAATFSLAKTYEGLDDLNKALSHNSEAIAIYEAQGNNKVLVDCYENQARFLFHTGQAEAAYGYLRKREQIQDSIFAAEKLEYIGELETQYETQKKEEAIKALAQERQIQELRLKQQRFLLIGLVAFFLILAIVLTLFSRQRKLKLERKAITNELAETKKRLALEQQSRYSELKALRSQMNPHFIFNALNSIQEYIMVNERKLARKYLGKFADLMRMYLGQSQEKWITLEEEVSTLRLYMELEALRFEDSLSYNIQIDKGIDMYQKIPSLLLQPYVENAFKHGLLHKKGARKLHIEISTVLNGIQISIEDNGVGRQKSEEINSMRNPGHRSFASTATKNRLQLINMDQNLPITEEIIDLFNEKSEAMGTRVNLKIPLALAPETGELLWEDQNLKS
ncbi:tetratricopeptide repeat-containing sensor histidine kinase [Sediminicola luteus]|uniref:Signal transduction histidine kinase internal region domain-containing protein n=1 Tax=Sediminicola luteus TaxID=319238 RepID=A0A2A4GAY5_9FLAO|nr:histidine kinase [Sediminicola luteus]PCE64912.1 hypothetical protein B7P33_07045 [Sediminicola luteus]